MINSGSAAGPIYIGELAPPEIRGKIMSFWQMFYSVGSFIAYWIAYATKQHLKVLGYALATLVPKAVTYY